MEDQLSSFRHQREFDFVHSISYLVVIVMHTVEEEDHRNVKFREVIVVRSVVESVWIIFSIISVIQDQISVGDVVVLIDFFQISG